MTRILCLLVSLMILITLVNAQNGEIPATVNKGRILTDDGQKIKFVSLVPGTEKYDYKLAESGQSRSIANDNVVRIEQQTGTEAGKWALVMGGAGLLGSLLGIMQATTRSDTEVDNSKVAPVVIGLTAASALVGVAIGSGRKKYKTVYSNSKYGTTSVPVPVRIGLTCSSNQGLGVGLQCRF